MNCNSFIDTIDSESGLLYQLLPRNVINAKQEEDVGSCPTTAIKNEELLSILKRSRLHDYNEMISFLNITGQKHIELSSEDTAGMYSCLTILLS